ncbi:MAG: hypothetical protein QM764_12735 [Chitinophagaceae bacterium]
MIELTIQQSEWRRPVLWATFFLYVIISGFVMLHHEMWGDEIHSWNIAKGSNSLTDLLHNIRYEGHPPLWYVIIWTISKFTHNLLAVQTIHWMIATASIMMILFMSPLPLSSKLLIPFGYYFLFEYAILSRNYAAGILLALVICSILYKNFRYKEAIYYVLIFLLSNTHLIGILLAASFHVCFLVYKKEQGLNKANLAYHALFGAIIVLPAACFIFPPSDSSMNVQFWLNRWGIRNFRNFSQAPLRAFVPIPAWWLFTFWNTQFMIETANKSGVLAVINIFISATIVMLIIFILKNSRRSVVLFTANLFFSFVVAMSFFTLGAARYAGFLYIGFIAACWLYCYVSPLTGTKKLLVNVFLILQVASAIQPVIEDARYPFSNAYRVNELLNNAPAGERIVCDYWTLNVVSAFADKPFYCIDLQEQISFLTWNNKLKAVLDKKNRFTDGVRNLFSKEGINKVLFISINPPDILSKVDPQLEKEFSVSMVDKREGSIDRSSNLYLYEIRNF